MFQLCRYLTHHAQIGLPALGSPPVPASGPEPSGPAEAQRFLAASQAWWPSNRWRNLLASSASSWLRASRNLL